MLKECITIKNNQQKKLYGILSYPPDEKNNNTIIIFFQGGIGTKTGVGDYLRIIADRFTKEGFTVLRMDQRGTGDSQGELPQGISMEDLFCSIQSGLFKDDSLKIIKWTAQKFYGYRLFLFGECGGAISQVLAGAEVPDLIDGLIMMACPVLYPPLQEDTIGKNAVRAFDAKIAILSYLRKSIEPRNYIRLLLGKSDWQLIWGSVRTLFSIQLKSVLSRFCVNNENAKPDHDRFNWIAFEAFKQLIINKKPILFLLPQLDNETFEFETEFKEKVLIHKKDCKLYCTYTYLPETDHNIMFQKSRDLLCKAILNWFHKVGVQNV